MFGAYTTNDGKYLMMDTRKDCDDLGLVSYADITGCKFDSKIEFKPLISEWLGGFSYIHNIGSQFYFKTNYKASKSRVITMDLGSPAQESWVDVIPEHEQNVL
jgi:prolyl oligopeptidase